MATVAPPTMPLLPGGVFRTVMAAPHAADHYNTTISAVFCTYFAYCGSLSADKQHRMTFIITKL